MKRVRKENVDSNGDGIFLLQYGFKPANIDPSTADLEISSSNKECKVTHFRMGDGEQLNFAGVQSSLQSKEYLLQFHAAQKRFSLSKVTGSFTNIRQKIELEANDSTKIISDRSRDRVEERLKKMTRKVTVKITSKIGQTSSIDKQEKEKDADSSRIDSSETNNIFEQVLSGEEVEVSKQNNNISSSESNSIQTDIVKSLIN